MTISNETATITLPGNGSATAFAYDFLIPYQADGVTPAVSVYVVSAAGAQTPLVLSTDFSISGVGDEDGGVVTYPLSGSALPTGAHITILRALEYVQSYTFTQSNFNPANIETALDTVVEEIQQLNVGVQTSLRVLPGEVIDPIGSPIQRASTVVGFDATGAVKLYSATGSVVVFEGMPVPVEAFGTVTPGVDCSAVIQAALNGTPNVCFSQGVTYTITHTVAGNEGNLIWGYGAELAAGAGMTDHFLLGLAQGMKVFGVTFNGLHSPTPSATWLGVGTPVGNAICADGTGTPCDDGVLEDCSFSTFPSGGVFLRECHRWDFNRLKFANMQTYTTHATSAVVETFDSDDPHIVEAQCDGYTGKGINLGNANRASTVRPHFYGSGQDSGFACYYEDGCSDSVWESLRHEGVGFFFKAHDSRRCTVRDVSASGTIYAQAFKDFKVFGGTLILPDAANQAVILEGIAPIVGVAGGPGDTALIDGLTARRTNAGTTSNHVLLQLSPDASYPVERITVRNCVYENMLIGVNAVGSATAFVQDFEFSGNTGVNTVQNEVLSFALAPTVRGNRFENAANAIPAILVYGPKGGQQGKKVDIAGNTIIGRVADAITIGADNSNTFGTKFDLVSVRDNNADGALTLVNFDISNTVAGNKVGVLVVRGNEGTNQGGAPGMALTFHTSNTTRVNVQDNVIIQAGGAACTIVLTNQAQIAFGNMQVQGIINQVVNRPVNVHPLRGTTAPVAGLFLRGTPFWQDDAALGGVGMKVNVASGGASFIPAAPVENTTVYTITNPVANRAFDTTTVTLPQLAQVVGTMIADEQGQKIKA